MMKLEFDPGLIEEVVFRAIREKEEQGDTKLSEEYHLQVDPYTRIFLLKNDQYNSEKWSGISLTSLDLSRWWKRRLTNLKSWGN
ncbi:MAG: hypothetical protein A2W17_05215 [Planctomycetes bacterium RBG_16_41_13]|nr:MAG: hypothetical protein A2W17_05215 [Planctomycetes bacterium RBG_16_41_13]